MLRQSRSGAFISLGACSCVRLLMAALLMCPALLMCNCTSKYACGTGSTRLVFWTHPSAQAPLTQSTMRYCWLAMVKKKVCSPTAASYTMLAPEMRCMSACRKAILDPQERVVCSLGGQRIHQGCPGQRLWHCNRSILCHGQHNTSLMPYVAELLSTVMQWTAGSVRLDHCRMQASAA
jgi:hypothetical protein